MAPSCHLQPSISSLSTQRGVAAETFGALCQIKNALENGGELIEGGLLAAVETYSRSFVSTRAATFDLAPPAHAAARNDGAVRQAISAPRQPDNSRAHFHRNRIKSSRETGSSSGKVVKGNNRKTACSFCAGTDHTIPTCKKKDQHGAMQKHTEVKMLAGNLFQYQGKEWNRDLPGGMPDLLDSAPSGGQHIKVCDFYCYQGRKAVMATFIGSDGNAIDEYTDLLFAADAIQQFMFGKCGAQTSRRRVLLSGSVVGQIEGLKGVAAPALALPAAGAQNEDSDDNTVLADLVRGAAKTVMDV